MKHICQKALSLGLFLVTPFCVANQPSTTDLNPNTAQNSEFDVSQLGDIFDLSEIKTKNRKTTIRQNLHIEGNISQGAGSRLSSDIITAASQESVCVGNNLAVCPCKSLLVNKIQPIQKTIVGQSVICSPDPTGVTSFGANAAVWPDKQLLANQINPSKIVEYTCYNTPIEKCEADYAGTTAFGGNVMIANEKNLSVGGNTIIDGILKIKDAHAWGQTDIINFKATKPTPVLLLHFKDATNPTATGAFVNLKLFGVIVGHTKNMTPISFDSYIETTLYAGPSDGFFTSQQITEPIIKFGHTTPNLTGEIIASYTAGPTKHQTLINLSINYTPIGDADFICNYFIGNIYYEIIGSNVDSISPQISQI